MTHLNTRKVDEGFDDLDIGESKMSEDGVARLLLINCDGANGRRD